ncbi:flagellar hook-length control protein FliK [Motiliproteus sp. MSK22-1]|uniref:flagellar hook-length control protein FliK n=1 Tax=Motiliproteus sp. MSK22-1 TaxID=1897630 RepID=UPI00097820DF|nr:flagellar hook-length control protein FliK [Motiliproteus sp. MSK22-1]OMH30038.1 hypothetical protein BGP75_19095 [Motiliproteus sp. MSK22-1]
MSTTQAVSVQQTITQVPLSEAAASGSYMPEAGATGSGAELFGDTLKANMENGETLKERASGGSDLPSSGHKLPPESDTAKSAVEETAKGVASKNTADPATTVAYTDVDTPSEQSEIIEEGADGVSHKVADSADDSLLELQDLVEEYSSIEREVAVDPQEELDDSSHSSTVPVSDVNVEYDSAAGSGYGDSEVFDEAVTPVTISGSRHQLEADQLPEEPDIRTTEVKVETTGESSDRAENTDGSRSGEQSVVDARADSLLSDQKGSEADAIDPGDVRTVKDRDISAEVDSDLVEEPSLDSRQAESQQVASDNSATGEVKGSDEKVTETVPVAPSVVAMLKQRHPELNEPNKLSESVEAESDPGQPSVRESAKAQPSSSNIQSETEAKPSASEQTVTAAGQQAAFVDRPPAEFIQSKESVAKPREMASADPVATGVGVQKEVNVKGGRDSASADSHSSRDSAQQESQRFSLAALKEQLASISIKESGTDTPFKSLSSSSSGTAASSGAVPFSAMVNSQSETARGLGLSNFQQLQQAYKGDGSNTVSLNLSERFGSDAWTPGVSQRVSWMASQQIGRAELRLDPPELGSLNIRLTIHQDQASLSITSPSAQVREVLEQQMPRLREMLAESGIDLQQADVSDQPASQQSDKRSAESENEEFYGDASDDPALAASEVNSSALSLVDYYA